MNEERKVVGLFGDAVLVPGKVYPKLVAYLEEILEKARSGEMVGCICVEILKDETSLWAAEGYIPHRLAVGTMEYAKHYLLKL